ncbi:MAG TPA: hypothetical protein ENG82_03075, partial [Bacteroidetes bacterium]|nr:hypothetical protein [Bacteroidota bacterium]
RLFQGIVLFAIFLLCFQSVYSAEKIRKTNRTFPFRDGGKLVLRAGDADVSISTWKNNEILLEITKRAHAPSSEKAEALLDAIVTNIQRRPDFIKIVENSPNEHFSLFDLLSPEYWENRNQRFSVAFKVTVPEHSNLKIETDGGDITIRDASGEIQAKTNDGDIEIRRCSAALITLDSGDGDILVSHVPLQNGNRSRLFFETGEGRVKIKYSTFEKISGKTNEGDLYLVSSSVGTLDFHSNEGDVEAVISPVKLPTWRVRTGEGNILLVVPQNFSAGLDFFTDEGTIYSDFKIPIHDREDGAVCKTDLNGGTGRVVLKSNEGDIRLEIQ